MSRISSVCLRILCLLSLLAGVTSCDAFWNLTLGENKGSKTPPVVEKPAPTPPKLAPKPQAPVAETAAPVSGNQACQDRLKERDARTYKETDPLTAAVEIDGKREFTDASLVSWAIETARKVYDLDACPLDTIRFTASGKDGLLYEGVIHHSDYKLVLEHRISEAEFSRRFEIQQMATLSFIKNSLRRARTDGDPKQAQTWADKWLEQEPGNLTARIVRANIELESGSAFDAIAFYEEVLRTAPDNPFARYNLAFAKKQVGSFPDAIKGFESLSAAPIPSLHVPSDEILLNLADAYANNNQLKEAQATLDRVKDKTVLAYVLVRANILRADKKFPDAKAVLDADKTHQTSDVLLFNRILLDLDLKDDIGARDWLSKLKDVNPKMASELEFLEPFSQRAIEANPGAKEITHIVPLSDQPPPDDTDATKIVPPGKGDDVGDPIIDNDGDDEEEDNEKAK